MSETQKFISDSITNGDLFFAALEKCRKRAADQDDVELLEFCGECQRFASMNGRALKMCAELIALYEKLETGAKLRITELEASEDHWRRTSMALAKMLHVELEEFNVSQAADPARQTTDAAPGEDTNAKGTP